ncbi:MAG: hypothetical protein QGI78_07965, partial [Phycisphaerales bacterium]|nr:hypothetical protein [Phycisphaerales bacterium]
MASQPTKKTRYSLLCRLNIPLFLCVLVQFSHAQTSETPILIVREWVNNDHVELTSHDHLPKDTSAVCVLFWRNGQVIGYGEAIGDQQNLLSTATRAALQTLRKDPTFRRLSKDLQKQLLPDIGIEVGIALSPTPIPTKNLERAAQSFKRGVHGIAIRRGDTWVYRFPSQMRLAPFRETVQHLEGLCIKAGAPASDVLSHQLRASEDVTIYTVDFTSSYQHKVSDPIQTLYRGDQIISARALSRSGLLPLADLLASYLIRSVWPHEDRIGITGTYIPEADRYDTMFAPLIPQAMAAEALLRYASLSHAKFNKGAIDAYTRIMNDLAVVNEHESPISNSTEASFIVLASCTNRKLSTPTVAMIEQCKNIVIESSSEMVRGTTQPDTALSRGLLAAAMTHISKQEPRYLSLAEKTIHHCITTASATDHASLIPWIAKACVEVHNLGGTVDRTLAQMLVDGAIASQVTDVAVPDIQGGFSLHATNSSVVDARGIRMVPMIACLLPEEYFTPPEKKSTLLKSLFSAMRFTAQLTTSEE